MPTNNDDMEEAYQGTIFQIKKEIIQYTLSLIQDSGMEVDSLRDFMKGFYVSKFVSLVNVIHKLHGNAPPDDEIIYQEYLKKINSSEKLQKLLNELI